MPAVAASIRGGPFRGVARSLLAAALILGVATTATVHPSARASGPDPCPEPNDEFQQACLLADGGDARGFIFHPEDVDAYRIEALDFNVSAHVELGELPFPYQLALANWNGEMIGVSSRQGDIEMLDATLGPPGTYYVFVQSRTGEFTDDQPYRISSRLTYPDTGIPQVRFSQVFSSEGSTRSDEHFEITESGGRRIVAIKGSGSPTTPRGSPVRLVTADLTDFTLVVDTRVTSGTQVGYVIWFRHTDSQNNYLVTIRAPDGAVTLSKRVNGMVTRLADRQRADASDISGGVNRTVVRAVGESIRVNLNGQDVLTATDATFRAGSVGTSAVTWGDPAIVRFDNLLVTSTLETTQGQSPAPGVVVLEDNFDDPASAALPRSSDSPTRYTREYEGGEYVLRTLDPSALAGMDVPTFNSNASIMMDVRLIGETENRRVTAVCRSQGTQGASGYAVTLLPHDGTLALARFDRSVPVRLLERQASPAIRRGNETNRLELTCAASTISVSVNGVQIASVEDATYTQGRWFIFAGYADRNFPVTADVRLDNLIVTQR